MNLLLLYDEDFVDDETARVSGERADHLRTVLKANAGDALRVGRLGGDVGSAEVSEDGDSGVTLRVTLDAPPPARPGIDLVLAAPRPKQLKRILPALASIGVDRIVLLNAARVEKSYFDSKVLAGDNVARLFDLGLAQGCDTVRPTLTIARRFRPFVEDELDGFAGDAARLVAHPEGSRGALAAAAGAERLVLAVGPEGGWVPFELELFEGRHFARASVGSRPLRTEIAVVALIGASGRLSRA
jgi:RsmE family RNA methyltransferase